jgi:hypothetical protein
MEDADGETILDITPETLVFDEIELVEAGVFVSDISLSYVDVVIGSTLVDFLQFQIETDDVSGAEFKSLRIMNIAQFDEDWVETVTLWRETVNGWVEIESESGNDVDGDVTIDGFNEDIPMSSTEVFMLTIDVTSNEAFTGDVEAEITEMELEDDNNDDIDVSAQLPLGSRVITIVGAGSLAVSFDDSDPLTDDDTFTLAGTTSEYVAAFELSAEDEDVSIESLSILLSANFGEFADSVSRVHLYDEDGNSIYGNGAVVGSDVATSGEITFNNLNPELLVSADNDTIVYIALQTKTMGDGQPAAVFGTSDFDFALEITEADGVTSNIDITAGPTAASNVVAVKPVLVTDLELVDTATTLTPGSQLARLDVTANIGGNNKEASGSDAKLALITLVLDAYVTNVDSVGFRLKETGGSTYAVGVYSGVTNTVAFDMTDLDVSDYLLGDGENSSFLIELDPSSVLTGSTSTITLEYNEANAADLEYSEEDDLVCGTDACISGGLRLGTSSLGLATADKEN